MSVKRNLGEWLDTDSHVTAIIFHRIFPRSLSHNDSAI